MGLGLVVGSKELRRGLEESRKTSSSLDFLVLLFTLLLLLQRQRLAASHIPTMSPTTNLLMARWLEVDLEGNLLDFDQSGR